MTQDGQSVLGTSGAPPSEKLHRAIMLIRDGRNEVLSFVTCWPQYGA